MFPRVFEIEPLAKIIVAFLPECQRSYWIECALLGKNPIASDLMTWSSSCLLNPIVFCACCNVGQLNTLLRHHTLKEVGAWLSNQAKTQSFIFENIEFKPIFVLLRDVTTWQVKFPNFVLDVLPFDATVDMYSRFGCLIRDDEVKILQRVLASRVATRQQDIALIADFLEFVNRNLCWSARMLDFLCGWSPIIQAKLVQLGQTSYIKLKDKAALEAMHVNRIWDKNKQQANFHHARNFQTIAILYQPMYKLHPKHCVELIDKIIMFHTLSSETTCKLLQPLWMHSSSSVEFLSLAFLQKLDPSSPCFLAMFPKPHVFLMSALEHHSPVAIDWAIDNLLLTQDDINIFITKSLAKSDFFYYSMNRIVKRWPRLPDTIIMQLAQHALKNCWWSSLDVLIRQKRIDHTLVATLDDGGWLSLAYAPQHIMKSLWCDTDVWRRHHETLFCNTLHSSAATCAFLWRKNNNVDLNLLIKHADVLFRDEQWDVLSTIATNVPNETVMRCYHRFALEYSDAKRAFLERNWPLCDQKEWIKLVRVGNEQFWLYCLKSGHVLCEHLLKALVDSSKKKSCQFLRSIHFDLDFHDQQHVQLLDKRVLGHWREDKNPNIKITKKEYMSHFELFF